MTRGRAVIPPTFVEAKAQEESLYAKWRVACAALDAFPRGPTGLTPNAVKFSPEFRAARATADAIFRDMRAFNAVYVKTFAKELRAARAAKAKERRDRCRPLP